MSFRIMARSALTLVLASTVACDSLLDVDNPASVPDEMLSDPTLAPVLVAGAIQSLQCGAENYAATAGMLSGEYLAATGLVNNHVWEWRGVIEIKAAPGDCFNWNRNSTFMGFYTPLQQARFQLDDAFKRLEAFTDAQVLNRARMMAQTRAYAGYAYLLLGEGMCEETIDGGPKLTREQMDSIAVDRFTDAITRATGSTDTSLINTLNMSYVGRARAQLDLKKFTAAAADANLVPTGYVRNLEFTEGGDARRENRIFDLNGRTNPDPLSVADAYRNLTVNGIAGSVADPRVRGVDGGRNGTDGVTRIWRQQKFASGAAPIPLASWNEAQLIYAEAVGGQPGFDAINRVRTANGVPTLAGPPPTGQAYTDLVLEERRRQLFSEGQRYSDMLRYNLPFPSGVNRKGQVFSNLTCVPLPDVETLNNPNLSP
jgi:hypothetical protein